MVRLVLVASLLAGCDLRGIADRDPPDLHVDNGTALTVGVFIGERLLGVVEPGRPVTWSGPEVPSLPWVVIVRTASGRELMRFDVTDGAVTSTIGPDGRVDQVGVGGRIDLSCGRLDVYAGPPLIGPPPDGGVPGDCQP